MIKNGDFVKLHYTGMLKDGSIFDTTREDDAKKAGITGKKPLKPAVICVGEGMLIRGLDHALVGKDGPFTVEISPGQAFGKKNPELIKIVPEQQLIAQQIKPTVGLELNIDGKYGIIRTISPGRIIVDFNHPLADKEVTYDVQILGTITEPKEQIQALLDPIGIPYIDVAVEGPKAIIKLPQMLPQPLLTIMNDRITKLTSVKTVAFEQGTKPAKA